MVLLLEGLVMSFGLLLMCVVGIANGPEKFVVFYEKPIRQRVFELGYTTEAETKKKRLACCVFMGLQLFVLLPFMVYYINGARGFWEIFKECLIILYIMGIFDKGFIDGWWVQKTNAWVIKGTEDLMPYIPTKLYIKKWVSVMVFFYPVFALTVAGVMSALI